MSKKNKPRRLWLNVVVGMVPVGRNQFVSTLINSIEEGTYELPPGWRVRLEWRNKEDKPMRGGEWKAELTKSRKSSDGFDKAVLAYLRRKLT